MKQPKTPFEDAQDMARMHPDTFHAPSEKELMALGAGDHVKVCTGGERFWLRILPWTESDPVDAPLSGQVANLLVNTHRHGLAVGDVVTFQSRNVYDYERS